MAPSSSSSASSRLLGFFSFLFDHPKLYGGLLLLLLTPPLFRILLYFTPLLLSTALCIFALFTIHPYVTATDAEVQRESRLSYNTRRAPPPSIAIATTAFAPPPSSSSSASSSSSSSSAAAAMEAPAQSWLSWMKGLNDIGRTWLEDKLREQGMALSEPASRETLLSLLQGSFSELVVPQAPIVCEAQEEEEEKEEATEAALETKGVVAAAMAKETAEESAVEVESEITEAEAEEQSIMDYERETAKKLRECSGGCRRGDVPEATQKVLEASRRIIDAVGVLEGAPSKLREKEEEEVSKEEGSNLELSSKLISSKSRKEANPTIADVSVTPAKLPRKLLEEPQASFSKTPEPSSIVFGPVVTDLRQPSSAAEDLGPKFDEAEGGNGDEELEVEEAEALVRSEFRMLEMEIEEVASKLPKIDQILNNFQKAPSSSSSRSLLFK